MFLYSFPLFEGGLRGMTTKISFTPLLLPSRGE
jgi:hypothetical protein